MRLDTHITSPRRIANGQGAWMGTLAEAIERHFWDFVTIIERDTEADFGDESMPTAEELAEHITAEMIEEVLDDPNVTVDTTGADYDAFKIDLAAALDSLVDAEENLESFMIRDFSAGSMDYSITPTARSGAGGHEEIVAYEPDTDARRALYAEILEFVGQDSVSEDAKAFFAAVGEWIADLRSRKDVAGVSAYYSKIKGQAPSVRLDIHAPDKRVYGLPIDTDEISTMAELEEAKHAVDSKLQED